MNVHDEDAILWLGDTGAQCHAHIAKDNDSGKSMFSIKMSDSSKIDVLQK